MKTFDQKVTSQLKTAKEGQLETIFVLVFVLVNTVLSFCWYKSAKKILCFIFIMQSSTLYPYKRLYCS